MRRSRFSGIPSFVLFAALVTLIGFGLTVGGVALGSDACRNAGAVGLLIIVPLALLRGFGERWARGRRRK